MAEISAAIRINDAFSGALDKLSAGLSKGQSGFNKLKGALSGNSFNGATKSSNGFFKSMTGGVVMGGLINKGMGLAGNGIRSLISDMSESNATWKTFEGNMHQLGASGSQINSAKADMQKFAQQTIYSASDMSSTYSQLTAVGIKNTGKLVKGFGGLAAAADNPQQAMKTLSQQATQMAAKPLVQWQDFKLMLEQTPGGISAVAKTMNMSTRELVKNVQDGKVKTDEFLSAIAKTGTNANFSKMATQYKTIGQAMDGLKETITNSLGDAFEAVNKVGIKAVSGLADKIGKIDGKSLAKNITAGINKIKPILSNIGKSFSQFFKGFGESGAGKAIGDMFNHIADAATKLTGSLSKTKGGSSLFEKLGNFSGAGIEGVAKSISAIADVIGELDPKSLTVLATAFGILKASTKGIVVTGIVALFEVLAKLDPGTLNGIAKALGAVALAVVGFKIGKKIDGTIDSLKNMYDIFKGKNKLKMPGMEPPKTPQMPDTGQPGKIMQNTGAYMKLGVAILMVGGAVTLAALGFKLLADAATQLASGGGAAIATFFGMVAAIAVLAVVVRLLGPAMIGASVGFLMFAAALLIIGAAIFVASAGITMLATQLPIISQYGLSAAVGLLALAGAVAVFGVGALVSAVGVVVLGAGLIVLAAGLMIAAVGALLFGVALTLIAAMSLVAGAGLMIMAVAMVMIAPMTLIAAVGMMMLAIAMVMIAPMAMIAAVGMLMLSMALILVG
ncbi:tape measure protein, partial [Lactobacillus gigeriorum]